MTDVRAVVLAAVKELEWIQMNPNAHYIIDKTMIEYVIDSLNGAKIQDIITVGVS